MLCVRSYLRYSLSYPDLEEMMEERGLAVEHVTICGAGPSITRGCRVANNAAISCSHATGTC